MVDTPMKLGKSITPDIFTEIQSIVLFPIGEDFGALMGLGLSLCFVLFGLVLLC
jgi:hypothetical protein